MIFLERGRVGGSQTDGVLMGRCVLDEVNRNVSKISPAGMLGAWLLKHTLETRHNVNAPATGTSTFKCGLHHFYF